MHSTFFRRALAPLAISLALLAPAGIAFAAENPTNGIASSITTTTATLNATNGTFPADPVLSEAIWYGSTNAGPFVNDNPGTQIPPGWTTLYADTVNLSAGGAFSLSATGLSPNTTYYFVSWVQVGGIWYPDTGTVQSFTTNTLTQTITGFADPADATYGDAAFTVTASGGASGNPVTFSTTAAASVCTVASGGLVTITGVGTCDVTANQAGGGAYSAAAPVTQSFDIAPKAITVTGVVNDKVYDGTTSATLSSGPVFTGLVGAETLGLSVSFADKTAANTKPITATLVDGTGLSANYSLTNPNFTANITKRDLNITANDLADATKTYDGGTGVTANPSPTFSFDALQGTDDTSTVTLVAGTSVLASRNVGAETVTFSGYTLGGTDAGNYNLLNQPLDESQLVTALAVSVDAVTDTKVYDGTTASVGVPTITPALVGGDTTTSLSQSFSLKDVGIGNKTLVPSISINDGNGGANYAVTLVNYTTGTITAKGVTLTGTTVTTKVYDKTNTATLVFTSPALVGVVALDIGNVAPDTALANGVFTSVDAGTSIPVTVTGIVLSGSEAGNYSLTQPTPTGDITPRPLTVTAQTDTKVYDSTQASGVSPVVGALVVGDSIGTAPTQTFDTKDVGVGKTLSASGLVITDGVGGTNYNVNYVDDTTGSITSASVTASITASDKTYDGTNNASATCSVTPIGSDVLTCSIGGTTTFSDKNVANGKTVTATGIVLGGADAGNYTLTSTSATDLADITAKTLTVTAHVPNKVYDATTAATVTYTDDRVAGDVIGVTGFAAFNDKIAGAVKVVVLAPVSLFGPDSGNYSVSQAATTNADITPAPLTASFTASDKIYDGNTTAAILTQSLSGVILGDTVTVSGGSATFSSKNVGNNKTVTGTGFVLGGADGGNYSITTTNTTTASITKKTLTPTVNASNKVYDGNTNATISISDDRVSGDTLTVHYTTFGANHPHFDTKNVGTGKTVTAQGFFLTGSSSGNYTLSGTSGTGTADITSASITAVITPANKTYDGTNSATASCAVTPIGADAVTCSIGGTTTFSDKNVANGKTVTATGIVLAGADAGNYTLTSTSATGLANITKFDVTVTFTAANKVYDATTAAGITGTGIVSIFGGDSVSVSGGTAVFSDKNVGTGKTVSASGFTLTGGDSGNYNILSVTPTTANITVVTVSPSVVGVNKVYDGATTATATCSITALGSDTVNCTVGSASFADKNAANTKAVSVSGMSLSGTDADNYILSSTSGSTTADITARPITVTAGVNTKVYDALTTAATIPTISSGSLASGDTAVESETYDTKDVGVGKTLTPAIAITDGNSGNNYAVTLVNNTSGVITSAGLTVSFTTDLSKVYDATTTAAILTSSLSGIIGAEVVTVSGGTATFADKNVGTGKTVSATAFLLGGADAGNYGITVTTTSSDITAQSVTVGFTANNKQFDGTTAATIAASSVLSGTISGDTLTVSGGTATFSDSAVGTGKTVTGTGFILGGVDAGNYSIGTTGTTTADITAVPVVPSGGGNGAPLGGGGGGGGGFIAPPPSTPQGQVLGAVTFNFTQNLKLGMKGTDVTELQKVLIAGGFLKINAPTGYFGQLTLAAVKAYQTAHHISPVSGFVGPLTRAELNKGA